MQYSNRLVSEHSPYLLEHAHQPIDWFPWGNEAIDLAKERNCLVFLSIGYSSCHWCHEMAENTFMNASVAKFLNRHFISIKVDREERPDIDNFYIDLAQSLMKEGVGWPLNLVLTPQLEPFFAVAYLPPLSSPDQIGLLEVLEHIHSVWESEERDHLIQSAKMIVKSYQKIESTPSGEMPSDRLLEGAVALFYKMTDPLYGGLRGAPKFPLSFQLTYLTLYSHLFCDERAAFIAEFTLQRMGEGGIYDWIEGGFFRYCTDERWESPHFEKIVVENALLAEAFLSGWNWFHQPQFRAICETTLNFIVKTMRDPLGGFYCALGADASYYLLNSEEREIFPEEKITQEGLPLPRKKHPSFQKFLQESREKKVHPNKDRKIVVGWNGFVIHTLAKAGAQLENRFWQEAAISGGRFIETYLGEHRLWFEGHRSGTFLLGDYASYLRGALTLFEVDGGSEWFIVAVRLAEKIEQDFLREEGGYYSTDGQDHTLLARGVECADGAEPSPMAVHGENLLRLFQLTWNPCYLERFEKMMKAVTSFIGEYSPGYCYHLMNFLKYRFSPMQTLIVSLDETGTLAQLIRKNFFMKNRSSCSIIWLRSNDLELLKALPFLKSYSNKSGETTLYLCKRGVCEKPVTGQREIEKLISSLK